MRTKQVSQVLIKAILNRDSIMLIGDPGIGKSEIVAQSVDSIRAGFDDGTILLPDFTTSSGIEAMYIHAVISDPTEPKGMPWVSVSADGTPRAYFIPFGDLLKMMQTTHLLVVVLDDFGQAPPLVQASFMQIVRARTINGNRISESVVFVACTNERSSGTTGVHGILEPMKDRFLSLITVESNWKDWVDWAQASGRIRPEVIAYHRWCGNNDKDTNHLSNFKPTKDMTRSPSPRAWEYVSDIIAHKYPIECQRELFIGAVGEVEATAFHSFLAQYRDLVHPDTIINSPDKADIPKNPSVLWSILTALISRADSSTFSPIGIYADRLGAEWSVFLMTECVRKAPALKKTKTYVDWSIKHSEVQI